MDKLMNENNRKPRRTRGTPSYRLRNYFALSILCFGGLCGYIYHQWPEAIKLKNAIAKGKFNYPESEKERYLYMSLERRNFNLTSKDEPNKESKTEDTSFQEKLHFQSDTENESKTKSDLKNLFSSSNLETNCINSLQNSRESFVHMSSHSSNDEEDFIKPSISKRIKISKLNNEKEKYSEKKLNPKQNSLHMLKNITKNPLNIEQEHLEVAIAMSRSIEDLENPCNEENSLELDNLSPTTKQKIKIKRTLDQYGFKSNKLNTNFHTIKRNVGQPKRKKCKFITPTLYLRTEEDRLKLIEKNVSQILTNISIYNKTLDDNNKFSKISYLKPKSFVLRDYFNKNARNFHANSTNVSKQETKLFYNKIISPTNVNVGILLKDWKLIPGREKTPIIHENDMQKEIRNESANSSSFSSDIQEESFLNKKCLGHDISVFNLDNKATNLKESSTCSFYSSDIQEDSFLNKECPVLDTSVFNLDNKSERSKYDSSMSPELFSDDDCQSITNEFSPHKKTITLTDNSATQIDRNKDIESDSSTHSISLLTNTSPNKSKLKSPNTIMNKNENLDISNNLKNNFDWNNEIDHYENFHIDTIQCFDLTNSSDEDSDIITLKDFHEKNIVSNKINNDLDNGYVNSISNITEDSCNVTKLTSISSKNLNKEYSENSYDTISKDIKTKENHTSSYICEDNNLNSNEENDSKVEPNSKLLKPNELKLAEINDEPVFNEIISDISYQMKLKNVSNLKTNRNSMKTIRRCFSDNINIQYKSIHPQLCKKSNSLDKITDSEILFSKKKFQSEHNDSTIILSQPSVNSSTTEFCKKKTEYEYSSHNISVMSEDLVDELSLNNLVSNELDNLHILFTDTALNVENNDTLDSSHKFTNTKHEKNLMHFHNDNTNTNFKTPDNNTIIKTKNITPRENYSDMDTPIRNLELNKYGLKPMKRTKGIKILRYIYDSIHPSADTENDLLAGSADSNQDVFKCKKDEIKLNINSKSKQFSSEDTPNKKEEENIFSQIAESEKLENMIFERKNSMKFLSCQLPLHIAWHNLVSSDTEIQEKILLYEPVEVEQIHYKLKSLGFKFHIQDIITFLDKKTITIKVLQNNR